MPESNHPGVISYFPGEPAATGFALRYASCRAIGASRNGLGNLVEVWLSLVRITPVKSSLPIYAHARRPRLTVSRAALENFRIWLTMKFSGMIAKLWIAPQSRDTFARQCAMNLVIGQYFTQERGTGYVARIRIELLRAGTTIRTVDHTDGHEFQDMNDALAKGFELLKRWQAKHAPHSRLTIEPWSEGAEVR